MDRLQDLSLNRNHNNATSASRPLAPGGSRDVGGVERDFVLHNDRPTTARTYRDMTANLRSALSYPQMGLRSAIVEDAYLDTCQWLFNTPEYQRWRDPTLYSGHHGFFWIKGKPGSGKSTAMKTLLSRAESARNLRDEIVLSYFFNARGEALERSIEGLYRSLLHQITAGVASLSENVVSWLNPGSLDLFHRNGWQVDLLKSLLKRFVLLQRKKHLLCFIDALDEGDNEYSVRDMVEFLEDLSETVRDQHLDFSVCLASRHYPNISLHRLEELQLDDHEGHLKDIDKYVRNKTRFLTTRVSDDLVASIKRRSSGIFLWVVLVIAELKRQADHGNDHRLQVLLDSIPVGVERLLDDTLKKAGQDDCLVATLQWVLFSTRPLKLQEFHTAILLSNGELHAGAMHWDQNIRKESTKKLIVSASKGLLETVASDRIQFIHESVSEYFLRNGLEQIDHSLEANASGISHRRLARWCSKYLQLTAITSAIRSSVDPFKAWRRGQKSFPLLQYAMSGVLRHADNAAGYGIQLRAFDESFPFEDYLLLKSRTIGNFGEYKYDTSPPPTALHILIYEQCNHLTEIELTKYRDSAPDEYLAHLVVNSPADFVSGTGILEKPTENSNTPSAGVGTLCASSSRCIGGPLHIAAQKGAFHIALALIKSGASATDHCQTLGSPLSAALRHSNEDRPGMVYALIHHGADMDQEDTEQVTPLQMVINHDRPDSLRVLLDQGANPNTKFASCDTSCSPLILAARLDSGFRKSFDDYTSWGEAMTSLSETKYSYRTTIYPWNKRHCLSSDVLMMLLGFGAVIDAKCERCGMTAAHAAAKAGNQRAVNLLRLYSVRR